MLERMGNGIATRGGGSRRAVWYAGFAVYAAGVALFSGPGLFIYPISLYAWAVLADREGTGGGFRTTVDLELPDVVTAEPTEPISAGR